MKWYTVCAFFCTSLCSSCVSLSVHGLTPDGRQWSLELPLGPTATVTPEPTDLPELPQFPALTPIEVTK